MDSAFNEAIYLFRDGQITSEMRYSEFESLLSGAATLEDRAGERVPCAYVAIGSGLIVRGLVFFELSVAAGGVADSGFNVPLRYLVRNAGSGPDLGGGPIRLSCRGRCSVPWHASNLWQPDIDGPGNAPELIRKAVRKNRLGFKADTQNRVEDPAVELARPSAAIDQLKTKADAAFANGGRVSVRQVLARHAKHVEELKDAHRVDIARQQQAYLDQIRQFSDEINRLRSALRQEKARSKRLQLMLRGEAG